MYQRTFQMYITGAEPAGYDVRYIPATRKLWEQAKSVFTLVSLSCHENSSFALCHESALVVQSFTLDVLF